jgi:hypothetical protein
MLDVATMKQLFKALDGELAKKKVVGEIGLCGGAVMCLVYHARKATKDIDAIFQPTKEMRDAARRVAKQFGLDEHWLNDAVKGFFHADPPREEVLHLPHLRVWAPRADYMLAMKCISARFDTHDADDVRFLIDYLRLTKPEQVFDLVAKYYPDHRVPAKTKFFVEELMSA